MAIDSLNYFLTSLIVFFGLFAGMLLIFIAPEEKKPGLKHFFAMQCMLLALLAGVFSLYYGLHLAFVLIISLIMLLAMIYHCKRIDDRLIYTAFGIVFFWRTTYRFF